MKYQRFPPSGCKEDKIFLEWRINGWLQLSRFCLRITKNNYIYLNCLISWLKYKYMDCNLNSSSLNMWRLYSVSQNEIFLIINAAHRIFFKSNKKVRFKQKNRFLKNYNLSSLCYSQRRALLYRLNTDRKKC